MEIAFYKTKDGKCPYQKWFDAQPREARARILARLARVRSGNLGIAEPIGEGIHELKIHFGPGYRVYFVSHQNRIILLLCGSEKDDQKMGIQTAKQYWKDYRRQNHESI